MDIVSIIVDAIVRALSYIVSALVYIGKPILVSLYDNYVSRYLLSPQYAFPSIVNGSIGEGVKSLYYFLMFNIYDPVLTIIMVVVGLIILLNSSIQLNMDFRNFWIKLLLLLILSNISFFLFQDFLYIGSLLYSQLWDYGFPSHNFSSGSNVLAGLQIGGNAGSIVSLLILFVFLFLMIYLMLFLSLRAAIIYTFPVLVPIFTLLMLIPRTKEIGERIWFTFIDSLAAPILMAIPLILSTYVRNDSALVLGFLALADAMPTMLALSQSSRHATGYLGRSVGTGMGASVSYVGKGARSAKTIAHALPKPTEGGIGKGEPVIGSIRQLSPLNSGSDNDSSMFFKVK